MGPPHDTEASAVVPDRARAPENRSRPEAVGGTVVGVVDGATVVGGAVEPGTDPLATPGVPPPHPASTAATTSAVKHGAAGRSTRRA